MIAAHLDALFPGMEVLEHYAFRVTRDADFELSDDAEDLLAAMEFVLRQRTKFGVAVRLEVDATMTPEVLQLLCRELELCRRRRVRDRRPARPHRPVRALRAAPPRSEVPAVHAADAGAARSPAKKPTSSARCATATCSLHHPYDSFSATVEAFVEQAATDPERCSRSSRRSTGPAATKPASWRRS